MSVPASRNARQIRKPPAGGARKTRYAWETLSDDQLLSLRFCDLKLSIKGTELEEAILRLYRDLEHMYNDGIGGGSNGSFHGAPGPDSDIYGNIMSHCWDDGFEVEGGNRNWLMRILRHEAGHAIDSAYRLRRRSQWRAVFGPASLPYPDAYRPRPGSRRFVQHLGAWYAQAHPDESGLISDSLAVAWQWAADPFAPRPKTASP